jgi:hypothetical protein
MNVQSDVDLYLHSFLTSTLDRSTRLALSLIRFTPGERLSGHPSDRKPDEPQRRSGWFWKVPNRTMISGSANRTHITAPTALSWFAQKLILINVLLNQVVKQTRLYSTVLDLVSVGIGVTCGGGGKRRKCPPISFQPRNIFLVTELNNDK